MKNIIDKIQINLLKLIFPEFCNGCKSLLLKNEAVLCTKCLYELPYNKPSVFQTEELQKIFTKFSLEFGYYQLNFYKKGLTQKIIHQLKYKQKQNIGVFLAEMYLTDLENQNTLQNVDFIVPVPLHKKRQHERGYNQVETYAKTIAQHFNIKYLDSLLVRHLYAKTLTKQNKFNRKIVIENSFSVNEVSLYEGKHFLLIDDVFTTGATLNACATQLFKIPNIKLSIITMAYTKNL